MNTNRPLLPSFLKKADNFLLLNKPETWSARTHLVVYYCLLFIAALAGIAFLIPDDPRSDSNVFVWVGFTIVISFIALIVWLIFLFRFNVFKRFGNTKPIDRLTTFGLYLLAVGMVFLFPFVKPAVETIRANNAYSDASLVNDVNAINIKICQLEYDSLYHNWEKDTILVSNNTVTALSPDDMERQQAEVAIAPADTAQNNTVARYQLMDSAEFAYKRKEADSVQKLNDSLYVVIKCPEYTFLHNYKLDDYSDKMYGNYDIYKLVIKNFQRPDKGVVRKELMQLINKYKYRDTYTYYYDQDVRQRLQTLSLLNDVDDSISNIVERKTYWSARNMQITIRLFFYFTLAFALLVFVFRHSTKKVFFLSLLSGILLSIITSLVLAFSYYGNGVQMYVTAFYILLFFAVSLLCWRDGRQQMLTGISLNLFVLLVAFLPICIVSGYYSYVDHYADNLEDINYDLRTLHYAYAEIGGIILLLLLLPTYIHLAYKKWYALPEQ